MDISPQTQLLCTFSKKRDLPQTIADIKGAFEIEGNIYIFEDCNQRNNLIITYNVVRQDNAINAVKNTIAIHRKKETNTLYTINALNEIVMRENNGVLDRNFTVN